jgi:hypothetical protein
MADHKSSLLCDAREALRREIVYERSWELVQDNIEKLGPILHKPSRR